MSIDSFTLPAPDGHTIYVRHWPVESPRIVVQLCHGMSEHVKRYDPLGEFLQQNNIAMVAADHRGFGESVEHHGCRGHFADQQGWDKVVQDQYYVFKQASSLYPSAPVVVFGHSMGSYIAQAFSIKFAELISGLVLSGSNYQSRALLWFGLLNSQFEKLRLGAHGKSDLLDKLGFGSFNKPFEPSRTDFDWLSRDEAEVDKYINDPLCGDLCSNQLWIDLLKGLLELGQKDQLENIPENLPVYIFGGSEDPAGGKKGLNRLYNRYCRTGRHNTAIKVYPGGRHEMLNETNRMEVFEDLRTWIHQYF